MLGDSVTVLWTADDSFSRVARTLAVAGTTFVRLEPRDFVPAVVPALGRGAVVAVVADADSEELALSLGVDEVLHGSDTDEASLTRVLAKARRRANARELRERYMADQASHDGSLHMMLLGAAIAHEMNNPLAIASLNAEVLQMAISALLELLSDVKAHVVGGRAMPLELLERFSASPALLHVEDEARAALEDLTGALRDAALSVVRMSALTDTQASSEPIDLIALLDEFAGLVRAEVQRVARFDVDLPCGDCLVDIPRGWAMQIAASLIANSLEAVSDLPHSAGEVGLRLLLHDEVCVLEVRDNGVGMSADVRRRALEPFFTTRRPGALGLGLTMVIAQARRVGGDVLVESQPGTGTTIRVFLPTRGRNERESVSRLSN